MAATIKGPNTVKSVVETIFEQAKSLIQLL